jgi:hypothetical protein
VQDPPSTVLDDEPHVEHSEASRRDDEKVHRGDRISVIPQERRPAWGFAIWNV